MLLALLEAVTSERLVVVINVAIVLLLLTLAIVGFVAGGDMALHSAVLAAIALCFVASVNWCVDGGVCARARAWLPLCLAAAACALGGV